MAMKITFIIDNPEDPEAFEAAFPPLLDVAKKLPGLVRLESAKVFPKEDGSPTPAHRTLDLYFDDYDTASAAVASEEAGAFFQLYGPLNTPLTGLFSDIEEA